MMINFLTKFHEFWIETVTQAKKLMDGRLGRHGPPHVQWRSRYLKRTQVSQVYAVVISSDRGISSVRKLKSWWTDVSDITDLHTYNEDRGISKAHPEQARMSQQTW